MNISPHLVHLRIADQWDYQAERLDCTVMYAKKKPNKTANDLIFFVFTLTVAAVQFVTSA